MSMDPNVKAFAARFADAFIARDYDAAHRMLASWLAREMTPEALRETLEERLREMMSYAEVEELTYPSGYEIDGNSSTPRSLRDLDTPIPSEITDENFRKWLCIQFLADEDSPIGAWFDFWTAVVEEDGEQRIGYFELQEPD